MPKPLINLALALSALFAAVASFWRMPMRAGFLARRSGCLVAAPCAHPVIDLCRLLIAGSGLRARAAEVSARGVQSQAVHPRGFAPWSLVHAGHVPARTRSTTAFGLFDATRERGMGHPAG